MKNLIPLLLLGILTVIGCQSEPKNTTSNDVTIASASVPAAAPTPAPAPVAPAPEQEVMEKSPIIDEAPAVPADLTPTNKSVKDMETKANPTAEKIIKPKKVKEIITEKKEDLEAKMAAEKEKLAVEAARIEAEKKKKAEAIVDEFKEIGAKKTKTVKNTVEEKIEEVKEIEEVVVFSHQAFDGLLRKHVSSTGKVDYTGFKKDKAKLDAYLKELEGQAVESSWSKDKQLAYWINAYNAYTIDLITRNYPLKSITDLDGGKPWDKKFIKLNGKTLSLNNIENDIIRPTFKDARIHFAVNCAAKSCPPLMNKAWTESNLQSELEKRTQTFINNTNYNTISTGAAKISKIFEWYAVDFGDLNDYLAKYSKTTVNGSTKISYHEYDWSLNN